MGFRVVVLEGLKLRVPVLGLGFCVQRVEFRLQGSGIRVWDLGCQ